jgi:hypothetical protein
MSETVSSAAQWMRSCSLIVADQTGRGLELAGPDTPQTLRIRFTVEQEIIHTPKTMHARIYNLSASTVQQIFALASKDPPKIDGIAFPSSARIVLKAGYRENFAQIFMGQVYQMKIGKESNVNSYLDIFAADGDLSHNFATAQVALSKGYVAEDVLKHLGASLQRWGTNLGPAPNGLQSQPSPRGKVMFGMTRDYLDDFALTNNCTWAIRDGTLEVVPKFAVRPGEAILVDAYHGMVGTPEMTELGVRFTTLLNPAISWGSRVKMDNSQIAQFLLQQPGDNRLKLLTSPNVSYANQGNWIPPINSDGQYVVLSARHIGDTRGNEWYTDCICLSANPSDPIPVAATNVNVLPPPLVGTALQGPTKGVTPP